VNRKRFEVVDIHLTSGTILAPIDELGHESI